MERLTDAMNIPKCMKREDADRWAEAIAKEDLTDPRNFADGKPALVRVPKSEVPEGAIIRDSICTCVINCNAKYKARVCADGAPRPGGRGSAPGP